ncbi:MAG TPA: hypothetical protein VGO98_02505 [Candidatus Saccharimonadales bacterium]|jgi:hypothetical protein|nr:hypothetical protein [Candidatus Saccharimonadales bacterium]
MDQQQPEAPAYQPPAEQIAPVAPAKNKRKILALWLLIGPTALIVGSLILHAIANFILSSTTPAPTEGEMFGPQSPIQSVVNVILFAIGAISVITWLPGIIIGIILLTTQKKS